MKQLLKLEFERTFKNKKFIAVIILQTVLIIYDFFTYAFQIYKVTIPFYLEHLDSGKVENLPGVYATWVGLHYGQTRTILFSVLPLLCAFVYGASLYSDEKHHYNYQLITRTSRKDYYLSKLITLFISGGVIAAYPFILSLFLNSLILPFEDVLPALSYFMSDAYIMAGLFYKFPILYVLIYIILVFIGYGLLNCICIFATYIFSNGFVIMITPFCVYFCTYVISNFFEYIVSPFMYLRINDVRVSELPMIIVQIVIYVLLLILFMKIITGKERDIL